MARKEPPATPTLDKIAAIREQSQSIGEFLEWLRAEKRLILAEDCEAQYICKNCGKLTLKDAKHPRNGVRFNGWLTEGPMWIHRACDGEVEHVPEGLYASPATTDNLLHEFFGIDWKEEERERRALLDYMRDLNAAGTRKG